MSRRSPSEDAGPRAVSITSLGCSRLTLKVCAARLLTKVNLCGWPGLLIAPTAPNREFDHLQTYDADADDTMTMKSGLLFSGSM